MLVVGCIKSFFSVEALCLLSFVFEAVLLRMADTLEQELKKLRRADLDARADLEGVSKDGNMEAVRSRILDKVRGAAAKVVEEPVPGAVSAGLQKPSGFDQQLIQGLLAQQPGESIEDRMELVLATVNRREVLERAKVLWPDNPAVFQGSRHLHEYQFLAEVGKACFLLEQIPEEAQQVIQGLVKLLMKRLEELTTGVKGGWDVVHKSGEFPVDSALEQVQGRVEANLEKAKKKAPQVIVVNQPVQAAQSGQLGLVAKKRKVTCWNCGLPGHTRDECPAAQGGAWQQGQRFQAQQGQAQPQAQAQQDLVMRAPTVYARPPSGAPNGFQRPKQFPSGYTAGSGVFSTPRNSSGSAGSF